MSEKQLDEAAYRATMLKDYYKVRVVECEPAKTKNGHKMFKFKLEIVPREHGVSTVVKSATGDDICIDGLTLYSQTVISEKSIRFHNDCRSCFGLRSITEDGIESTNPIEFKGAEGFVLASGGAEEEKNEAGEVIKDPYTGKPKMVTRREVHEFLPRPAAE